jgi:hypothetical protein
MATNKKSQTGRARWMASSKLSAYQLGKIIEAYALERSASVTARSMKVSYPSVRAIYAAIRRRMVELGVYPKLDSYIAFHVEENETGRSDWHAEDLSIPLTKKLGDRKLAIDTADDDQISEALFRMELPAGMTTAQFRTQHHQDILQLLKLSGPLNKPLSEEGWARAFDYRAERLLERGYEVARRVLLAAEREIAARKRNRSR